MRFRGFGTCTTPVIDSAHVSVVIVLLYLVALPYVALLALVVVGAVAREGPRRTTPRSWPSVSVVIPAHDEADSLPYTLASLARQRYSGSLEFVVVDDRSRDGTPNVIAQWCARDPRFRMVRIATPGSRLSPKVHAVDRGIRATTGEIIVTTDADCTFDPRWVETLVSYFDDDVAMVSGYVESTTAAAPGGPVQRFDAVDWFTLMVTSRSLTRFGWSLASSANNQAYRRAAFDAAGGFGASGRAPSGDEDLLVQRIGRLPEARVVFADHPAARVRTQPPASLGDLLHQRRRWVSRYHHALHYHPGFLAGVVVLGAHSVVLSLAVGLLAFFPAAWPWVLASWGVVWLVQALGLAIGTRQLDRPDLWGWPSAIWLLFHPLFIGTVSIWSFLQPGDWSSNAPGYRRRFLRRRLREWGRKFLPHVDGA